MERGDVHKRRILKSWGIIREDVHMIPRELAE